MRDPTAALESSVQHLRQLVGGLDEARLESQAYPTEWSIADVLSHIGSGGVIMQRRIEDARADRATPDDFATGVWDTWNAKPPAAKAADALAVDRDLLDQLSALTSEERENVRLAFGPLTLTFADAIGLRLNEHALHTWDVEVVLDPAAVVPAGAVEQIVDNLDLIARFTGKPTGTARPIVVHTTDPDRDFAITLAADAVTFESGAGTGNGHADLTLPAEAFVRLVYGRLDPDHAPAVDGDPDALNELRSVFPGP
jgi:uncharacterized protein (TIGR03083 family)